MEYPEREIQSRLLSFYESKFAKWDNIRIPSLTKISDGWENEVYSFTAEYEKDTEQGHENLILRIYPGDHADRKAAHEFNGMRKLHELGFPVPEVFVLELGDSTFGKPFVIMEKIEGRPMWTAINESTEERRQELLALFFRMFADLHALDWRHFVADPSTYDEGNIREFFDSLIIRERRRIENFQMSGFLPVLDWLAEHIRDIKFDGFSVIHHDYHPNNVLLRDDGRAFVIDWTNLDVCDYRLDIAWTIVLGNSEVRDFIISGYERASGRKIQQIEFFEVAESLRRLLSISLSIRDGAIRMGMRPEAVEMMKSNVGHIEYVYALLHDRTGIVIPEVESIISSIS